MDNSEAGMKFEIAQGIQRNQGMQEYLRLLERKAFEKGKTQIVLQAHRLCEDYRQRELGLRQSECLFANIY
jgi:hypothetical protein